MSATEQTPERLVAAAERLFVTGGEVATSLRAIAREAHSNAAAVHYHFGGRDPLLRAVLERYLEPALAQCLALVDEAESRGRPVPVSSLVEAIVRPDLELLGSLRRKRVEVARFLGRTYVSSGAAVAAYHAYRFERILARVLPLVRESVPGVDESELRERLRLVVATVASELAAAGDSGTGDRAIGHGDVEGRIGRLVAFGAGGVAAPPGANGGDQVGERVVKARDAERDRTPRPSAKKRHKK